MVPDRNIYVTHNRQNIQRSERTAHVRGVPPTAALCVSVCHSQLKVLMDKDAKSGDDESRVTCE